MTRRNSPAGTPSRPILPRLRQTLTAAAQSIADASSLLGNIVVGIVDALLAGWLLPMLGVGFSVGGPILTSIIYAMIGAIVLLVLLGLVRRA